MVELGGIEMEFTQYMDPKTSPYHGDSSIAGLGQKALAANEDKMLDRLKKAGAAFHSGINPCVRNGVAIFRWVHMGALTEYAANLLSFSKRTHNR